MLFSPCLKKQRITGFNVRDFDSNAELNHAPFCVWEKLATLSFSLRCGPVTPLSRCQRQASDGGGESPNPYQATVLKGQSGNLRELLETVVGVLWQNNFHHNIKALLPLCMDLQQHSPQAARHETLQRLNAKAAKRLCLPLRAKEWSPRFALHCSYLVTFKKYRCPALTTVWFNWYMVVCGALGFLKVPLECAVKFNGGLFFDGYTVT